MTRSQAKRPTGAADATPATAAEKRIGSMKGAAMSEPVGSGHLGSDLYNLRLRKQALECRGHSASVHSARHYTVHRTKDANHKTGFKTSAFGAEVQSRIHANELSEIVTQRHPLSANPFFSDRPALFLGCPTVRFALPGSGATLVFNRRMDEFMRSVTSFFDPNSTDAGTPLTCSAFSASPCLPPWQTVVAVEPISPCDCGAFHAYVLGAHATL